MDTKTIAATYFELWSTTDDARRHELATQLFADDAVHHAAPADVHFEGVDAIEANITQVNTENIQKAGLSFQEGDIRTNHDSLQVEWSVSTPAGQTVATGRDFLLLNEDGKVAKLYMYNGI
ncbi:nuclear transport factor 2 family protein [Microbacterium sp. BWT-B31]|uniref:nuclear transport factor 2 family protein n=1 Tax=Microbacterium sp. BWT-B31 TaxID=3232072 RepID=UPI003529B0C2